MGQTADAGGENKGTTSGGGADAGDGVDNGEDQGTSPPLIGDTPDFSRVSTENLRALYNEKKDRIDEILAADSSDETELIRLRREITSIEAILTSRQPPQYVLEEFFRIPLYYNLGSILESLSYSLAGYANIEEIELAGQPKRELDFVYTSFKEPIEWSIINGMSEAERGRISSESNLTDLLNENKIIENTFTVPVGKDDFNNLISDKEYTSQLSVIELIKEILELPKLVISGLNLTASFDPEGKTVSIFQNTTTDNYDDAAAAAFSPIESNLPAQDQKSLILNYGSENSLIESINLGARMDPAYMSIFRVDSGNLGFNLFDLVRDNSTIRNEFTDFIKSTKYRNLSAGAGENQFLTSIRFNIMDGVPISSVINNTQIRNQTVSLTGENALDELFRIYELFLAVDGSSLENNFYPAANRALSAISSLSEPLRVAIFSELVSEGKLLTQRMLNTFLLTADATIHGTVGFAGFDHAVLQNYIPGIGGLYTITDIDDVITPGSFTTTLSMSLTNSRPNL